jgi:hypothetical protein
MKKIIFFLPFLIISFAAIAQEKSADQVKALIESQNFVFKAQMANPEGGGSRQLNSDYDVTVTRSKVTSFLPYFGRVYSPTVPTADPGIKFTSTSFDYSSSKPGKTWQVNISPKDVTEVRQLLLTVYNNGNATLDIISNTRQGISFRGYIK